MEKITCSKCNVEKPVDCYYFSKKTGQPYKICKDCNKMIYKERRSKIITESNNEIIEPKNEVIINLTNNISIIIKMLEYTPSFKDFVEISKLLISNTSIEKCIDIILKSCQVSYPSHYVEFCYYIFTSYPAIEVVSDTRKQNPLYDCVKDKELIGEDI